VVADSSYAVLALLKQVSDMPGVSLITRLRLDTALYDPTPARALRQNGRPRKKGVRRPTLQHVLRDAHRQWTPLTVSQ
jgi:DDE superfamily endonuclease